MSAIYKTTKSNWRGSMESFMVTGVERAHSTSPILMDKEKV